uniref:Helicase ATP-binding domain-containing protein n=1 Tax=Cynoglossus semilaevis TaxID=244447 RepID=A0A3P8VCM7_CYNSE
MCCVTITSSSLSFLPSFLSGIQLRKYQLDGVKWMTQCLEQQQGCILGDEMGLGKTCQTISLLLYIFGAHRVKGPFLILSPLSVLETWCKELSSLSPSLKLICYKGDKRKRVEIQREVLKTSDFHLILTTYEVFALSCRWQWKILVVDEAHRLKNQKSMLHQTLTQFSVEFRVLLTGTPIQNNLQELYSLLTFIHAAPSAVLLKNLIRSVDCQILSIDWAQKQT